MEDASAAYGDRVVFENLSILIRKGDGVALVGDNGTGKTTLLKLLTGDLTATSGRVKLGSRVKIGYFSQEHEGLNNNNSVVNEIMLEYGFSEERARHYLGAFLFQGDDVFKIVGDLSGGEKARLAILKLMLTGANFLILDEPTNHLDIPAKEAVEEAILSFPGTFLTVSHDRYFLDKVANCMVELANGKLTEYAGNYSYYREKQLAENKVIAAAQLVITRAEASAKKQEKPRQRTSDGDTNLKNVQKLEGEIAMIEMEIKEIEYRLNDPANQVDPEASQQLADEYNKAQADLAEKYDGWLELTEE